MRMKNLFGKFGIKETTWNFVPADLAEITEELKNPARGWYQIYTFQAEQEPDFEEFQWSLDRRDTLALVLIDIGSFRKEDLDDRVLDRIGRIFSFFEQNKYDCIVRVVYDHEGRAFVREPSNFAQVQTHMRQIGNLIEQKASSVYIYQGMLLGNWGEMHGSRFLDEVRMLKLAEILREQKAPQTFLAVRRPAYWRSLHGGQRQNKLECTDNMGLFDDGIFGSASHLGTFAEGEVEKQEWNEPWKWEQELEFENELGKQAPNGGEAVYGEGYIKMLTPEKMVEELREMQITYLNKAHDTRLLDIWKKWRYQGQGVWNGKSVYDYVGAHLGYRFLIRNVDVSRVKGESEKYRVTVEIENTGFAGFYQEAEIYLEYTDRYGMQSSVVLDSQVKGFRSGEVRRLSCVAKGCNGGMFLVARRKQDGAKIRFANRSDEEGRAVLGHLNPKN